MLKQTQQTWSSEQILGVFCRWVRTCSDNLRWRESVSSCRKEWQQGVWKPQSRFIICSCTLWCVQLHPGRERSLLWWMSRSRFIGFVRTTIRTIQVAEAADFSKDLSSQSLWVSWMCCQLNGSHSQSEVKYYKSNSEISQHKEDKSGREQLIDHQHDSRTQRRNVSDAVDLWWPHHTNMLGVVSLISLLSVLAETV